MFFLAADENFNNTIARDQFDRAGVCVKKFL